MQVVVEELQMHAVSLTCKVDMLESMIQHRFFSYGHCAIAVVQHCSCMQWDFSHLQSHPCDVVLYKPKSTSLWSCSSRGVSVSNWRWHCNGEAFPLALQGLATFQGGVLMVSHDQHLISSTVDELWQVESGTVKPFHGTFEQYKQRLRSSNSTTTKM